MMYTHGSLVTGDQARSAQPHTAAMSKELAKQLASKRDALDNLAEIRQRLQREKAVVDGQLQNSVDAQVKLLTQGSNVLAKSRQSIETVKTDMTAAHDAHKDSFILVRDFEKLRKLSAVVSNFDLAQRFVNNFWTLRERLDEITAMMDGDGDFTDIEAPLEHLLPVHHALDQLRQMQEQAEYYARMSTEDVRQTIRRHFSPLSEVVKRFDMTIMNVADALLDIVQHGDRSLVVRVAKLIDFEERKDLLAAAAKKVHSSQQSPVKDLSQFQGSVLPVPLIHHAMREYPKRFWQAVERSVSDKFEAYVQAYPPEEVPEKVLDKFDWVYKDLFVVREDLTKCMPERWGVMDLYVKFYHAGVHKVLNQMILAEPAASVLLQILEFTKDYYDSMRKLFKIPNEHLKPPLLDGRDKEIYDDFLELLVSKLKEWYKTVSVSEKQPFIIRSTAPDSLDDNTLVLNTHTDMAKLVSQQLDAAAESGQGRIVLGCVNACCDVLVQRQNEWIALVQQEVHKEISENAEDVPAGLFEYLVALANEQDRAHDFLSELAQKWSEPLSKRYKATAAARFEETGDGYTEVALASIRGMVTLIFNDLNPAFKELFASNNWKSGVTLSQICGTLTEYLDDARTLLIPDFFVVLAERLLRDVVLEYLRAMSHSHGTIKVPKGRDRILEDVKELYSLFANQSYDLDIDDVREYFKVFGVLTSILSSPVDELSSHFQELREIYWDAPLDLFENMVALRKDLDKREVRDILARIRHTAAQLTKTTRPSEDDNGDGGDELQKTFLSGYRI